MTVRSRRAVALLAALLVALAPRRARRAPRRRRPRRARRHASPRPTQETLAGGLVRPARPDVAPPGRSRSAAAGPRDRRPAAEGPGGQARAPGLHPGGVPEGAGPLAGLLHRRPATATARRSRRSSSTTSRARCSRRGPAIRSRGRMARGYSGAFGRAVNSPWVWIPLCVLFVVPVHRRPPAVADAAPRPARAHRLLRRPRVLQRGEDRHLHAARRCRCSATSWAGCCTSGCRAAGRRSAPAARCRCSCPCPWLAIAAVFLRRLPHRAERHRLQRHRRRLRGRHRRRPPRRRRGALRRLPGRQRARRHVRAGHVPGLRAVRAAAALGRRLGRPARGARRGARCSTSRWSRRSTRSGRRIRGPRTGVVLAYAWLAFPFSLFVSNTNANDALPAVARPRPRCSPRRARRDGVRCSRSAGLTKFAPLALVPLFARARRQPVEVRARLRRDGGGLLRPDLPERGHAAGVLGRDDRLPGRPRSPFSIYGLWGGLDWLRVIVAGRPRSGWRSRSRSLPRRSDLVGLAALAAAVLLAVQLSLSYWFFLYIAWVAPLIFVALLCREGEPAR